MISSKSRSELEMDEKEASLLFFKLVGDDNVHGIGEKSASSKTIARRDIEDEVDEVGDGGYAIDNA